MRFDFFIVGLAVAASAASAATTSSKAAVTTTSKAATTSKPVATTTSKTSTTTVKTSATTVKTSTSAAATTSKAVATPTTSTTSAAATITPTAKPYSYILTGDSTTAPKIGWGDEFCKLTAQCTNLAVSGRTTATYRSDGFLAKALTQVKSDISLGFAPRVTIQFGHNDQKVMNTSVFMDNLKGLIKDIKGAGGLPIVVTSLCRRTFNSKGNLTDVLQPWADAAAQQATNSSVPSVDLHGKSMAYISAIGKDAAWRLNAATGNTAGDTFAANATDTTHLNVNGSIIFSRVMGDLITRRISNANIKANATLSASIDAGQAVF
ncbi:SGNH hydrolase-type esterase domain-containing protein [Fimicolochytrium jonesii]|uniref:SGNH hydrolase-type esterase domain-containing protein n=1 Tax=Fimicolochytrium jonesii TaxID=1396493 RepID=UPI0022FDC449|nr:SGNH hydrolase-type esterase domain-containing protein [Fimicolochytrium jonesii]KAI8824830.1 SGNH hydrolase-type esterase domain-containing protein [Fimicolochytrium jonesii]